MADYSSLLGGGGGATYGNSGSSGVSTPVTTTTGGIGSQSFIFGGNPNITSAVQAVQNPWVIAGAVVAFGLFVWMKRGRR